LVEVPEGYVCHGCGAVADVRMMIHNVEIQRLEREIAERQAVLQASKPSVKPASTRS